MRSSYFKHLGNLSIKIMGVNTGWGFCTGIVLFILNLKRKNTSTQVLNLTSQNSFNVGTMYSLTFIRQTPGGDNVRPPLNWRCGGSEILKPLQVALLLSESALSSSMNSLTWYRTTPLGEYKVSFDNIS